MPPPRVSEHAIPSSAAGHAQHAIDTMTQTDDKKQPLYVGVTHSSNWFVFTFMMVAVNLLMLVVALAKGGVSATDNPMLGPSYDTLQSLGARWVNDVLHGRVYLLFTQIFLPVGIIRFLLDLGFYYTAVASLERVCGFWRTLSIFFLSGIVGNITGSFFVSRWLITGPSSALFGCIGALLALYVNRARSQGALPISLRTVLSIAILVVIAMVFGCLPGQDNFSQIGGLVAGYLACLAFASDVIDHRPEFSREYMVMGVLSSGFLFVAVTVILFLAIDINKPCFWCMRATCLPAQNYCNAGRLGSGLNDYYAI